MAVFGKRVPWYSQPQYPVKVNRSKQLLPTSFIIPSQGYDAAKLRNITYTGADLTKSLASTVGTASSWVAPTAQSYLTIGDNPFAVTGKISFVALVKATSRPADAATIITSDDVGAINGTFQFRFNATGVLQIVKPGEAVVAAGLTALDLDKWYVVGVSVDPATGCHFYIDGRLDTSVGFSTTFANGSVGTIGANYNQAQYNWRGDIAAVCTFKDKYLSAVDHATIGSPAKVWQIFEPRKQNIYVSAASGGPTLIELTAATFNWTENAIQNRLTTTISAPTLTMTPQSTQNRSTITTSLASLQFTAQSIQNKLAATLTAAALNFVAQAITIGNSTAGTVIELTLAAFNFSAQTLQATQSMALSAASWVVSPQSIQNRAAVALTAATMSFVGKALQNKSAIGLTAASFSFIAWSIDVTGAVASVVARLLTLLGVGS